MQARNFKQPWFTLLTHVVIAWSTYRLFRSIQYSFQIDHDTIDIFELYGIFTIGLIIVLTAWVILKKKKVILYSLPVLFLIVNICLYFSCLDNIKNLPYEQRFVFRNETSFVLTDLKIIGNTVINLGTLQPNEKTKATYKNYIENSSIDMTCNFGKQRDTLTLVAGLTNSVGYLNHVSIKIKNDKLKVDVTQ